MEVDQSLKGYSSTANKYIRSKAHSMRIRLYLPKKTKNTSGLCWSRKATVKQK